MKILIPVDMSDASLNAVKYVALHNVLSDETAKIELLHAQPPVKSRGGFFSRSGSLDDFYTDTAEKIFSRVRGLLPDRPGLVVEKSVVGVPDEAIALEAEKFGADLIVMGSRGLGPLKGFLKTSVSTGVISLSRCPVLVIRGLVERSGEHRVGIAVDGSDNCLSMLEHVLRHRAVLGGATELTLINVVNDFHIAPMSGVTGVALPTLTEAEVKELQKGDFEETMGRVRPLFEESGINTTEVCLSGNPAEEISQFAKDHGLHLLVMGSRGFSRVKSAVMGSVASAIAAKGDIPLLIVRPAD